MKKGCFVLVVLAVAVAIGAVLAGPRLTDEILRLLYPRSYEELVEREAL